MTFLFITLEKLLKIKLNIFHPQYLPYKGGQGLVKLNITMYMEQAVANKNSTSMRIIDTSYDHIDAIIASGKNKKPFQQT